MTTDIQNLFEDADTLFFEAEAPEGFLTSLESKKVFDETGWQRLWQAVANLITLHNGELDGWARYDLTRIVDSVQNEGAKLTGRSYEHLDNFELHIIDANIFIRDILTSE